jgi:hypothetical protein
VSYDSNRGLGLLFGLLGAALLVLDGLFEFALGALFLVIRHPVAGVGAVDQAVIFIVLGLIVGFFTIFGRSRGHDETMAAGLVLIVLAFVGWLALGFASGLISLLASVLILIAGILFLVAGR